MLLELMVSLLFIAQDAMLWPKNAIVYYLVKLLRLSEPIFSSVK